MKRHLFRIARLEDLGLVRNRWLELIRNFSNRIAEEEWDIVSLESELIMRAFRTWFDYGNLIDDDECADLGGFDAVMAEELLDHLDIRDASVDENKIWLSYSLAEIALLLRRCFSELYPVYKFDHDGENLHFNWVDDRTSRIELECDDTWAMYIDVGYSDTGLPLHPSLREFKRLMFNWQELYGNEVGKLENYEGCDAYYVGRNRDRVADRYGNVASLPSVPMGNRFAVTKRYSTTTPVYSALGIREEIRLDSKLNVCYAYYLDAISKMTGVAMLDEPKYHWSNYVWLDEPKYHWSNYVWLADLDIACHCGNWTSDLDEGRFCHGLVIKAIAHALL